MFEGWELHDILEYAKSVGYDGVEIAPFTVCENIKDFSADGRTQIVEDAETIGIEIVGLHWLLVKPDGLYINHPDFSIRGMTIDYLKELTKFCGDIGGKVMVLGSPKQRNVVEGINFDTAWDLAKDTFQQVMPVAEEKGVTICIEPLSAAETDFINTAEDAMRMAREVDHPNLKIILDVKAMSSEGRDLPGIIHSAKGMVGHVHANDANRRGPGFGDTDFFPVAKALREIGYDGYVSVEVFDYSPDPQTIASKSIEYLRKAFS
jgi:sugar phosphate isomerase/epimerase